MTRGGAPGVTVTVARPAEEETPLRTDVAGFVGATRRGPVGEPLRVSSWRGFTRSFGGITGGDLPYAVRGYFENGGRVAHVARVAGEATVPASATWTVGALDSAGRWDSTSPASGGFPATAFDVAATSPGAWGNGVRLDIRYRAAGVTGGPEVDVTIEADDEPSERWSRVRPRDLVAVIAASALVRMQPSGVAVGDEAASDVGRRSATWAVRLAGGADAPPDRTDYLDALARAAEVDEVALLALPDVHELVDDLDERLDVLATALELSHAARDRLVVLDVPRTERGAGGALAWGERLKARVRASRDETALRAAAVYHPRLVVRNGGTLTEVASSGHVAGVISRLDRERGAYYSPANAWIYEAVDVAESFHEVEQAALGEGGLNLLRCAPGGGLHVWGARTLEPGAVPGFVAHRRLVHTLVRAIRRVAEPLVFESNTPELRLTLVRAITTVLLKAFEAGALLGARPEEAFTVQCDDANNPPESRDEGLVVCDVDVAPAAPVERIHLRLTAAPAGLLEVVEA